MDNIQTKNTEHGAYNFAYDDLYRLETVDNPDNTGLTDESFTYDGVGNRLTSVDFSGEWGYNDNNELTGYDDVTYEYDANGNMVKKTNAGQVTSFVYNTEDRLVEVWDGEVGSGSLTASYYYDPFGRRLWKDVGGVRTYFHYSDEGLIGEYDSTGAEIKTYGYKPGSTWTTDPLFVKENGQYYFYHNDHLGTPQKITAVNGAVVWSAKYESFGKANVEIETVENNLRFPGQYFDQETGLHYNCWRYYEPGDGRYLKVDPIGFGGGINFYIYSANNPIRFFDELGLYCTPWIPTFEYTWIKTDKTIGSEEDPLVGILPTWTALSLYDKSHLSIIFNVTVWYYMQELKELMRYIQFCYECDCIVGCQMGESEKWVETEDTDWQYIYLRFETEINGPPNTDNQQPWS